MEERGKKDRRKGTGTKKKGGKGRRKKRQRKSSDEVKEEKKKVNVKMCPIMTSISSSESFLSRQFQRG